MRVLKNSAGKKKFRWSAHLREHEYTKQDAQKGDLLTRPTLARRDAPYPSQGRRRRPTIVLPSSLVYFILRMARMSSPLRASNESLLLPSVPPSDLLAQGSCRAILPPAGGLFQHPARK